tara:strand:- start:91 stop:642 length:552 start_codon:yes stop_codon:yes gene_type:complete|eukprot:g6554.t1
MSNSSASESNSSSSSDESDSEGENEVQSIRGVDWLKAGINPHGDDEVQPNHAEAGKDSAANDGIGPEQFQYIEAFLSKKGKTLYRCSLCPSKGPFPSEEAVVDFMKGKYFLGQLRKITRLLNPKKEVDEEALKSKLEKRKERQQLKRKAKNANLTPAQIKAKKEKFQRKKQRREERKKAKANE